METEINKCILGTKIWGRPCQKTEGTQVNDLYLSFLQPFTMERKALRFVTIDNSIKLIKCANDCKKRIIYKDQ